MRLFDRLTPRKGSTAAPPAQPPDRIHIDADGELVIDLREPPFVHGPAATTDMPCPNCGGDLRVDSVDNVARVAEMDCPDCGFRFHHRLRQG